MSESLHILSLMKRGASRVPTLSAHISPYHSSVTLFEAIPESTSTVRRSKRLKLDHIGASIIPDLEDTVIELPTPHPKTSSLPKPKTLKSPRKSRPIPQSLEKPHPAPPRWRETYDTIKRMRSRITAPVDTMGCDQAQFKEIEPKNARFSTLVSLMLSSQTKDEVTDAAVSRLREAVGGSISVDAIIAATDDTVADAISKVGFWRRKTQYIKQTAQRLRDEFDSDVPNTVDDLCSLPGVGPKMAFLALQVAWNLNVGIGVDVHVHRITNRLGWHNPPTKVPEQTRLNLQSWLPTELHPEINHLLVGFGQTVCLPVGPRCNTCELSTAGLCPSAKTVVSPKKRNNSNKDLSEPEVEITVEPKAELLAIENTTELNTLGTTEE